MSLHTFFSSTLSNFKLAIWSVFTESSISSTYQPKFPVSFIKDREVMGKKLTYFLFFKDIIFVKIMNNVTDAIVPVPILCHNVHTPLL